VKANRGKSSVLIKLKRNKFLSGSAIYLLSNILNAAIPFLLLPILTRYLTPAEYGEVAMFQTLLGALGAFVGLSVVGAAGRKYYDNNLTDIEMARYIGSCLQLLGISSVVVFILIFILRENLSIWLGLSESWVLWAVGLSAFTVVVNLRLGQWQVRGNARNYGAIQVSKSILDMMLSLLFVTVLLLGADGRISAQILATGLFAILALWLLKRDKLLSVLVWNKAHYKEIVKFGVPLIPHVGGAFLLISVDRFVINAELGLADAGVYMVAAQLAMGVALIFDAVNKAYVPWLFKKLKENDLQQKKKIIRYTYLWYLVITAGAIAGFFIGPLVVNLVAGSGYEQAGEVIGWLLLGQAFNGMYLMVTNYIFYSRRTGLLSAATITSGLINLLLLVLLIKLLGLSGAAISFTIAMGVRFLLTWWVAQKRHPMPWFDFLDKNSSQL